MRVTVTYPLRSGALVLRTALDWDRDVLPVQSTPTSAVFVVDTPTPTLALKPCIRDGGLGDVGPGSRLHPERQ